MDSNLARTRIDQFFNSKKNRSFSPKTAKESSSQSAKGSLEGYLVNSQNEDLSNTQGVVKRSLALEVGLSEEKESEKTDLPPEGREFKGLSSSSGVGCSGGVDGNGSSDAVADFENPGLKQFAMDFLSMYCGNIPSAALQGEKSNKHKRQGSPSLLLTEGKSSKIRHSVAAHETSKPDPGTPSCGKRTAIVLDGAVAHNTELIPCSSREVDGDNYIPKQIASLRKCDRTTSTTSVLNECSTPASLHRRSDARKTPISAHGSSMFSPGEAFWNEAIQVVDGMFTQADKPPMQDTHVGNLQFEGNSHNLCKASSKDTLNAPNVDSNGRLGHTGASISLPDKHVKLMDKESSPLPVKHFDFSCEVKNLNESTPCPYSDNKKSYDGDFKHYDCSSVTRNPVPSREDQSNVVVHKGPKTTLVNVIEEKKMDILSVDCDSIISDSPNRENVNFVASGVSDDGGSPLSFIPPTNQLDLSNWLPPTLCDVYRRKGILKLYPWQVDCLQVEGVLQKRNLVYCASTSAGKSFVAEILMLRRVLETGKMALLVLPYVSICVEKAEHLEVLLEPLGKQVRSYYGTQGGGTLPKDTSVAVCTIEKANSLINRLLEEDRLSEVGIIVIDELHMVADPHRGYLLELLVTKLRYAVGEGSSDSSSTESSGMSSSKGDVAHGLQIVGMSATMPNVAAVADWLHAALYQTEFRPVPLEEFIKVGNTIYNKTMEIVRTIPKSADLGGKDPDHVVQLCNEVVQDGHSVLIFCSSRKGCESTARHISIYLKKFSFKIQDEQSEFTDISSAIDALRRCPVGLDPVLEETLPSGVAYHHAGLTVEEREIIETCYRKGLVRVLTATSTLAAGVNLPARRVIFRQPRIGRDFIDGTRYKQMAGRAGRTGIDAKGESVLICRPEEVKRIRALINDNCPPLHSCLSEDKNGMTHAILEVVAGGIVQTANDIHRYVRCTLLNSTKPFEDVVKSAQDSLKWLCHKKFLEWSDDTKLYSTTPLGRAAFGSSLSPEESLIVLDDLSRAREGIVLASDLHLVYLATPINVEVEPDWELYYERFMELPPLDQSVGNRVGVVEPFLMRMAHGAPLQAANRSKNNVRGLHGQIDTHIGVSRSGTLSVEQSLRVCKRFYVALILSKLVQEVAVSQVCEAFKVARGMVQALQENAGRFASMVSLFCERLGWLDLEGLIAKVQNRVSFGVRAEIVELTTIPHVKGARARALYKAGLRTPQAIAEASVNEIAKALFESSSWTTQENIAQRRVQLGVAKKVKNAARKIVLDKAEEAQVAAFSAYQSLGLNVPQFTRPLLSPVSADPNKGAPVAIGYRKDNTGHSTHIEDQTKHHIPVESIQRRENEVVSDTAIRISQRNLQTVNVLPQVSALRDSSVSRDCVPHNMGGDGNKDDDVASVVVNKEEQLRQTISIGNKKSDSKGPTNIASFSGLDSFLDIWESVKEFFFDIHFNKRSQPNSSISFEIHGVAVCWENSPVYYVNLPKVLLSSEQSNSIDPNTVLDVAKVRWFRISRILENTDVRKFTWNLKAQVQVLKNSVLSLCRNGLSQASRNAGIELVDGSFYRLPQVSLHDGIDLCIVAWILWPDEERSSNPSLEKEVKKRLSSAAAAAANQSGRWKNQMRRAAHNGCCLRVAQIRALHSFLWNLLVSEDLVEPLFTIEIPLVKVLADMEDWGIGVDMEGCLKARYELSKKLKMLEKEAYRLAGKTFSLFMPADVANILYEHLKLPIPEGNKGKQHASTDKHSLDLLRFEHPIVLVIKEHRSLAKLLNSTLGSICSLAKLSMRTQKYIIQGRWLQTSTATGRLSMEEPNLQCVEHMIEFKMQQNGEVGANSDPVVYKINARHFFVPTQENWLLITADYSQIELRLMAHFSKDRCLIELLSDPRGDAFTLIASRWKCKPENEVSSQEREQTKRLVYGILYGMGSNSLSEQLNCSVDEAKHKIQSFKNSFPGVSSWLHDAVSFCRLHGYVRTLKGRKRFLSKIKLGDSKEKAKAQRQAVNSICQGSAADIIKIAMVNIYSVITGVGKIKCTDVLATKFSMLKGNCRILLQVHDELVVEADPSVVKEAGLLLKTCMENAVSLLVPLQVKVKVGRTWGSLEPFDAEQVGNDHASHP